MEHGVTFECGQWARAALLALTIGLAAEPVLAGGLTINGDGTATDNHTGLVWDQCGWGRNWNGGSGACDAGEAETFAWAEALGAAVAANAANHRGHHDWRLPSKNELESLVKIDATAMPAIDPAFPWPYAAGEFWTSTTYLPAPDSAWRVDFQDGGAAPGGKEKLFRVRLVRGGRPAPGSSFDVLDDSVPPVLSGVGVSGIGRTDGTLTATSNEAATGYWIVVARNATAPTAMQIQAGVTYGAVTVVARGFSAMTAGTATSFAMMNLSAGTDYDVWLVAQDANANDSAPERVPFATNAVVASYGPIPTRKSGVTAELTVAGCTVIDTARFIDAPPGGPAGMSFPYGLLEFTASDCGATATVTVTYSEPLPSGTYYKELAGVYGPYAATVEGNRTVFTLTDNGTGDDHPAVGTIRDPSGLAVAAAPIPASIPALDPWTLALLCALLGLVALRAVQATG